MAAVALTIVLLPLRGEVNVSTVTLIFIIPGIGAEVVGGITAGLATVLLSASLLDFFFIPPYGTLSIGSTQNWVGLGVYLVVVALVGVTVWRLKQAHAEAQRRALSLRRVYELSELLVRDESTEDLLHSIVEAVHNVFEIQSVALFVLDEERPTLAAAAGLPFTSEELHQLESGVGHAVGLSTALSSAANLKTVSLSVSGRPVGVLVFRGDHYSDEDREMLFTFANDAAIAMERADLRERARRSSLLEEIDQLRQAIMGAVSHDLRTPLATIKVASSTLVSRATHLSETASHELHELIDLETDRLTRLLSNLLDMTRIEAGFFQVRTATHEVADLVDDALSAVAAGLRHGRIQLDLPVGLPSVDVDPVLITQVLVNLVDNAQRHSPEGGVITIAARPRGDDVIVFVEDQGSGVPAADREAIFNRFVHSDTGGRSGLGLTIAKTFVEAHGQRIWCEEAPGGGARFAFTLPGVRPEEEAS